MNPYNPYAPPPPQPGMAQYGYGYGMPTGPYRDFDALVMPKFGQLANVCTKCSNPQVAAYPRKNFSFTPQWVWIAFCVSPLIGAILSGVMRKSAAFNVPLCQSCDAAWKKGNMNLALSFGVGVVTLLIGIGLCAADLEAIGGPLIGFSFLALLVVPLTVQFAHRRPRTLWTKKIDDRSVWLMGLHASAADATCMGQNTIPMQGPPQMQMQGQPYTPPHLMG